MTNALITAPLWIGYVVVLQVAASRIRQKLLLAEQHPAAGRDLSP